MTIIQEVFMSNDGITKKTETQVPSYLDQPQNVIERTAKAVNSARKLVSNQLPGSLSNTATNKDRALKTASIVFLFAGFGALVIGSAGLALVIPFAYVLHKALQPANESEATAKAANMLKEKTPPKQFIKAKANPNNPQGETKFNFATQNIKELKFELANTKSKLDDLNKLEYFTADQLKEISILERDIKRLDVNIKFQLEKNEKTNPILQQDEINEQRGQIEGDNQNGQQVNPELEELEIKLDYEISKKEISESYNITLQQDKTNRQEGQIEGDDQNIQLTSDPELDLNEWNFTMQTLEEANKEESQKGIDGQSGHQVTSDIEQEELKQLNDAFNDIVGEFKNVFGQKVDEKNVHQDKIPEPAPSVIPSKSQEAEVSNQKEYKLINNIMTRLTEEYSKKAGLSPDEKEKLKKTTERFMELTKRPDFEKIIKSNDQLQGIYNHIELEYTVLNFLDGLK